MGSPKNRKIVNNLTPTRYSNDRNTLFRVFPETLWILIFNKFLQFPESLFALLHASPILYDLHQSYCITNCHLFALIWPILLSHMSRKPDFQENKKFYQSFTLGCRSVCRSWCSAIDNFFSTHPGHYPNAANDFRLCPQKATSDWPAILEAINPQNRYESDSEFDMKLNAHFESTHEGTSRSPFVFGTVNLGFVRRRQLIQNYGLHIIKCSLMILENYDILLEFLSQMPNLKTLDIKFLREPLEKNAEQKFLPGLPILKFLSIGCVTDNVANALLLTYGNMLTHLQFTEHNPTNEYLRRVRPFNCTRLKHFKATIKSAKTVHVLDHAKNAEIVEVNFIGVRWPLFYIFQILEEKLPKSCTTLVVEFTGSLMQEENQRVLLGLKNVQKLKLVMGSYLPIDFVLGLQDFVEALHVSINHGREYYTTFEDWKSEPWSAKIMQKEKIQFLSCLDQMQSSNIWDLLPKLKNLRLDLWNRSRIEHYEKSIRGLTKHIY